MVSLNLYDSATRSLRPFVPLSPGKVGIYLCGATVQGLPHIGHMRSALVFDVLIRWLRRNGLDVTYVRNVTDIDDKILDKSAGAGVYWWAWAFTHERAFTAAYSALGIEPPTYEPRATGHVTDMVELMDLLVERGHAYRGQSGNVYFDVQSWAEYGRLTRQKISDMAVLDEDQPADKRSPYDFALWKAPKQGEPVTAAWPTPYGRGRPGWHLECSAMSRRYLGDTFDIHGGGIDLRFPHHENEQAQSRAAGLGFAQHWIHNAWVTVGGEKMSKSLGNSLLVENVLATVSPAVLRMALGTAHYRSVIEYSEDSVYEAEAQWTRIVGFVTRAAEHVGDLVRGPVGEVELAEAFARALDDDLNIPAAMAVIHEHVKQGNTALAGGDDMTVLHHGLQVRAMMDVLGLDPLASPWVDTDGTGQDVDALDAVVRGILTAREEARARKDFATADALRNQLAEAGIVVEDGSGGSRWSFAHQ